MEFGPEIAMNVPLRVQGQDSENAKTQFLQKFSINKNTSSKMKYVSSGFIWLSQWIWVILFACV